jgi:glutamate formiminotransferase
MTLKSVLTFLYHEVNVVDAFKNFKKTLADSIFILKHKCTYPEFKIMTFAPLMKERSNSK